MTTDLALSAQLRLIDGMSSVELSICLARTPAKPIGYGSPDEATLELLGACGAAREAVRQSIASR